MARATAAGVLLLASAAAACDGDSAQAQTTSVMNACCSGGVDCDSGVPATCSAECAPQFIAFWEDCGAFLNYLPGADAFTDFYQMCDGQSPDDSGGNAASCDAGELLTIILFSCSAIDQNNPNSFCNTECSTKVQGFINRCGSSQTADTAQIFEQAKGWLGGCAADNGAASCHSSSCFGDSEAQCAATSTRAECTTLNEAASNVFCRWQSCGGGGDSPPPPVVRPGCMDSTALNYDPTATVQSDGACLYDRPPSPPQVPCTATSNWACDTQEQCEAVGMQWVPCSLPVFGGCTQSVGQCTNLCSAGSPENCYTKSDCDAAGNDAEPDSPGTQWYEPKPPMNQAATGGRCERACSTSSLYTCRTQSACTAVQAQWVPGSDWQNNPESGNCEKPCSSTNGLYYCHTRTDCIAASSPTAPSQWVPSTCCGEGCPVDVPGNEAGNCQAACSEEHPSNCHDQVSCEAIGRQWAPTISTSPGDQNCPASRSAGSCTNPCTTDHYYNCRDQASCDALDLQWNPAVVHDSGYTEPARCSYACSVLNPNQCNTQDECESISFNWVYPSDMGGTCPGCNPMPYCEEPCVASNPQGCSSQRDCESSGNQWGVETLDGCVDFGCGGDGGNVGFRRLGESSSGGVSDDRTYAHCESSCTLNQLYSCKDEISCADAGGAWQDASPPPPGCIDCGFDGPGTFTGSCQESCSFQNPYACKDASSCSAIGGTWAAMDYAPDTYRCDITNAGCPTAAFLSVCGQSVVTSTDSFQLCNTDCGRLIVENYDRCSEGTIPLGMTSTQWQTHFGPIVAMCHTLQNDPELSLCSSQAQQATDTLQRVCCTDSTQCDANNGSPTKCNGECADVFLPFFESCGPMLMGDLASASSLGSFYSTCSATGNGNLDDPQLCLANNGNSPWTAISFRSGCSVWIKYVDSTTGVESADFVRLVSVGRRLDGIVSTAELLDVSKSVCGKLKMVRRMAQDFSGILALADVPERSGTLTITVNHPTTGNQVVTVTNNAANRATLVASGWENDFDVNIFSPETCPGSTTFNGDIDGVINN